jgi:hypothetical protein
MKRIIRLTESDLTRIVKRVLNEQWEIGNDELANWKKLYNNLKSDNIGVKWQVPNDPIKSTFMYWGPWVIWKDQTKGVTWSDIKNGKTIKVYNLKFDDGKYNGYGATGIDLIYKNNKIIAPFTKTTGEMKQAIKNQDIVSPSKIPVPQDRKKICEHFVTNTLVSSMYTDYSYGGGSYFVDKATVWTGRGGAGYGGGVMFETTRGKEVWLNSLGLDVFGKGNTTKAKAAAEKLKYGIEGIDITGAGEDAIKEVAKLWKGFDLNTQNEFLKEWTKLQTGVRSPIFAIIDDYEDTEAYEMVADSLKKIENYCATYITAMDTQRLNPIDGTKYYDED